MENKWMKYRLGDVFLFNPKESIQKGKIAKKIAMDKLQPFTREITGYELAKFSGGTKFRNGDTLVARITPCLENGKTSQVSILEEDEIAFGSTEYIVLRAKEGITDCNFVYYFSINPNFRNIAIQSMVGSSGRQRVQQSVLENIEIDIPPLNLQQNIASILSSLDNKIELNNRINDNLEQQAQAIFKSWFVDFEPFKDSAFVESELGRIPEGWETGTIGDYCKVKSGFAFKSAWWQNKGIKVLKIKNINGDNTLNLSDCSFVSKDKVSLARDFLVSGGDLLIAMTGATIGKFTIIPTVNEQLLVNQRVGKFFLGNDPLQRLPFIYSILKQESIYNEIVNKGQGSAQPNISPSDIECIDVIIPHDKELEKFNQLTRCYFERIIQNSNENKKLSQLRDTLLPKLISGELSIDDI